MRSVLQAAVVVRGAVRHVKQAIRHQHETPLTNTLALLGALFILKGKE